MIRSIVVDKMGYKLFFVESICDDPRIIEQNIMVKCMKMTYPDNCLYLTADALQEVKISSPDYKNMNTEAALKDFLLRIEHYQEKYQPLDEVEENVLSYMKIFNTGERIVVNRHEGHIQSRIVYYLMNIHITPRTIYFTRVRKGQIYNVESSNFIQNNFIFKHGESDHNIRGLIGGDSDLSQRGVQYAKVLANYIKDQHIDGLRVWTSWLKRTIQTVADVPAPQERWKALNEIDAVRQTFRKGFLFFF